MKKFRPASVWVIEGASFLVDIDRQVLRQTNDPENEISFINHMQDHQTFYRLLYDPAERNAATAETDPGRIVVTDLPQLTALDPEGMAEKYGIAQERLAGRSDFEVIVDQALLQERLAGKLPEINIAGEAWIIDLRLKELRHTGLAHQALRLDAFRLSGDRGDYEAFYHPASRQIVSVDPKLTELPEGVVLIRLPNELALDPVGVARQYGQDERYLLRRFPVQRELKAAMIPLSETNLPALIRRNREELQQEHWQLAGRRRPKHRPHF